MLHLKKCYKKNYLCYKKNYKMLHEKIFSFNQLVLKHKFWKIDNIFIPRGSLHSRSPSFRVALFPNNRYLQIPKDKYTSNNCEGVGIHYSDRSSEWTNTNRCNCSGYSSSLGRRTTVPRRCPSFVGRSCLWQPFAADH